MSAEERFWARVTRGPDHVCWPWMGHRNSRTGYGRILVGKKKILAHRYSWLINRGDPSCNCVLHKCDNTWCVNPNHLFLGSRADNNHDKVSKGRQPQGEFVASKIRGSLHGMARIDESRAASIVSDVKAGARQVDVARKYSVSSQLVCDLMHGRRWSHVTGVRTA